MLEDAINSGTLKMPETEAAASNSANRRDPEIEQCLQEVDLLEMACRDAEENTGYNENFQTCPICGHHDCFRVYDNPDGADSFHCFSTECGAGGTAIDYLMHMHHMTRQEATKYLVHDLCGRPYTGLSYHTTAQSNSLALPFDPSLLVGNVNDKQLGRLFAMLYRDRLCYVPQWHCYGFFDGVRWRKDVENQFAKRYCKEFVDLLITIALQLQDDGKTVQNLSRYSDEAKRSHLIKDAMSELLVDDSQFDSDNTLLNVINGTIDLKTMEFREHRASDFITRCALVKLDSDARCDRWEEVLLQAQLGDEETVRYLQKLIGASLACDTTNDRLHILGFETRSGKGVIATTIENMLGVDECGYACNSQGDVFEKRARGNSTSARGNIAMMEGKRLIFVHEPPANMVLDDGVLKQITGGDKVTARKLYQDETSFDFIGNIIILSNHWLVINDRSIIDSGRIVVIPFEHHVYEADRDKGLKSYLSQPENLSGILNWCLQGLVMYNHEGLEPSKRIQDATEAYVLNSNQTRRFVTECLPEEKGSKIKLTDAFGAFKVWIGAEDKSTVIDKKQFTHELEICGVRIKEYDHDAEGKSMRSAIQDRRLIVCN